MKTMRTGRTNTAAVLAAAVAVLGAAATAPAEYEGADWPNWRGPNHDGISPETGWVADWSADGPPVAWRHEIGTGFSSMAVVGDRVYASGHRGGEEVVWCLSLSDGEVIWSHRYPAKLIDRMHEGGPASTPTVHEGRVYTLSKDGKVFCLDAESGDVLWRDHLGRTAGLRDVPSWGFASSGLIMGEKVIFQAGRTVAYNRKTGELIWKSKEYKPSYVTPTPLKFQGDRAVASLNSWGLVVLDASSGEQLSRFPWQTKFDTNATTPIIRDGKAFLSTGYNKGCALVDLQPGQAELIYRRSERGRSLSTHINTAVLIDGKVYGFDGNTHRRNTAELVCMNFETGKQHWRQGGLGVGSLIASDGKLIALTDRGDLVTARATPKGYQRISRAQVLEGKCWTAPVLSHGRILARNAAGELVCVDVRPE